MRIGFASIYAWRPHVEHTWFLATLAQRAGHEVRFLTCDGNLDACYTKELRSTPRATECLTCRLGGIRSFSATGISNLAANPRQDTLLIDGDDKFRDWASSSASTLGRFESPQDYASPEFAVQVNRLIPAVKQSYEAALRWIERERLDGLCLFNGRMDVTRGLFEAARKAGIPVVTHERTWFGDGIQLLPGEHCLGLSSVGNMVEEWKDRPLTRDQAIRAASLVARRFTRVNVKEWRAYNQNAVDRPWPHPSPTKKVLVLPSSLNEVWGHPDWTPQWETPLQALDAIMARLNLGPDDIVLRAHPNWAERIGKADGHRPESYYRQWAQARGVTWIGSESDTSTMKLIEECDALIVASGSAALEAGVLGKPIIATSPSIYHRAGFTTNVHGPDQLAALDGICLQSDKPSDRVVKNALRFAYTMVWRIPQYVRDVKAIKTTEFRYRQDADPNRFLRLFTEGKLQPDDLAHQTNGDESPEHDVADMIRKRDWSGLIQEADTLKEPPWLAATIQRRPLFRWIDPLRSLKKVGDR